MTATKTVISHYFGKLVKLSPKHRRFIKACASVKKNSDPSDTLIRLFVSRLKNNSEQRHFGNTDDIQKAIDVFVFGHESQWHKAHSRFQDLLANVAFQEADYLSDFVQTPNEKITADDVMSHSVKVAKLASKRRLEIDGNLREGEKYGRIAEMKRNQIDRFISWLDTKEARRIIDDYCWLRNRKTKVKIQEAKRLYSSLGLVQ